MTLRHRMLTTLGLVGLLFLVPADSLHGFASDHCAAIEDSEEQDECYDEREQAEEEDRELDDLERQELEQALEDDPTAGGSGGSGGCGGEPQDPEWVVTPSGVVIEAYSPDHECRNVKVRRYITTMVTDCWLESLGATGACGGTATLALSGAGLTASGFAGMTCIAGIGFVNRCVEREIQVEVEEEEEVCGD